MSRALVGAASVVLVLAGSANAEWYQIATSSTHAKWYMDPARLKLVNGKMQAWVLIDSREDGSVQYSQSKVLMSFDCEADTFKTLSDNKYDSYGKVVSSSNVPDYGVGYAPVVPDTMAEGVEKIACHK